MTKKDAGLLKIGDVVKLTNHYALPEGFYIVRKHWHADVRPDGDQTHGGNGVVSFGPDEAYIALNQLDGVFTQSAVMNKNCEKVEDSNAIYILFGGK